VSAFVCFDQVINEKSYFATRGVKETVNIPYVFTKKEVATTNNLKDYFFGSEKFGFIIERYDTFNKIM
jgi:hypothetical protein